MSQHKDAKRVINISSHSIASTWPCPEKNLKEAKKNCDSCDVVLADHKISHLGADILSYDCTHIEAEYAERNLGNQQQTSRI